VNNCRSEARDVINPGLYREIMEEKSTLVRIIVATGRMETISPKKSPDSFSPLGASTPHFVPLSSPLESSLSLRDDSSTQTIELQKKRKAKKTQKKPTKPKKKPVETVTKAKQKARKLRKTQETPVKENSSTGSLSMNVQPAMGKKNETCLKKRMMTEPLEEQLMSTSSKGLNRSQGSPKTQDPLAENLRAQDQPICFQKRSSTFQPQS
jgi:hypothetical protein